MSSLTPEQVKYYEEHEGDTLQPNMLAAYSIGLTVAFIAVMLRCYARKKSRTIFEKDDWLILLGLLFLTAYAVIGYVAVHFGEGKHTIFVTDVEGFMKAYIAAITTYACTVMFTKISLLCFYCRIFFVSRGLVKISWVFGVIIVLYNLALVLVAALQCIPVSALWTGASGKCIKPAVPYTTLGIVNVVTDFAILALPIRFVMNLHLPTARKIQVCGIFLLGGLVCIFGVIRVVVLAQAPTYDQSYTAVWSGIWSYCEIAIGIVAACLPTLGPLFNKASLVSFIESTRHLLPLPFSRGSGPSNSSSNVATLAEWPQTEGQASSHEFQKSEAHADTKPLSASTSGEKAGIEVSEPSWSTREEGV